MGEDIGAATLFGHHTGAEYRVVPIAIQNTEESRIGITAENAVWHFLVVQATLLV
jgi:hypothetical protein